VFPRYLGCRSDILGTKVGNRAFADYADAHLHLHRINNKRVCIYGHRRFNSLYCNFTTQDLVPILPGKFLGYHHASGEIHIRESEEWVECPGRLFLVVLVG
jgi:hypothetical protein